MEAEKHEEDRRWARELAEKVTSTAFGVTGSRTDGELRSRTDRDAGSLSPEELLPQSSHAEAFRTRPRPYFWLYVLACGLGFGALAFVMPLDVTTFVALSGLVAMLLYGAWWYASPICPGCRQNVRTCEPEHCHVCGGALRRGRCAGCEVDHNWTGWFRHNRGGRFRWITHCPGCGAQLDTKIARQRHLKKGLLNALCR